MKVVNKNAVTFGSQSVGETFLLNNELYMTIFTYNSEEVVPYTAVNLATGALHLIRSDELVVPVLGHFVLEDFCK